MRITNIAPRPITESGKAISTKTRTLNKGFPRHLEFIFDSIVAKTVLIKPRNTAIRLTWEISDEALHQRIANNWTCNLAATGINLSTFEAGLIDGMAFQNGRQYLVWAFLDDNFQWAGIGITRKPFSTFSAVANGSLGSTTCTLTVPTGFGFHFVIGSRVVIRNTSGTGPLFQYNWGTVTAIADTTLTLTLDNNANYGTLINSATGGEVKQWNTFRPYIVTTSSQTLYKPYYTLLGELYTDSTTGNIHNAYKVTDEYRSAMRRPATDQTTAVAAAISFTFSRDIPLWADKINAQGYIDPNSPAVNVSVYARKGADQLLFLTSPNPAFSGAGLIMNTGYVDLDPYASLFWVKNNTTRGAVYALDYRVQGGMRL